MCSASFLHVSLWCHLAPRFPAVVLYLRPLAFTMATGSNLVSSAANPGSSIFVFYTIIQMQCGSSINGLLYMGALNHSSACTISTGKNAFLRFNQASEAQQLSLSLFSDMRCRTGVPPYTIALGASSVFNFTGDIETANYVTVVRLLLSFIRNSC